MAAVVLERRMFADFKQEVISILITLWYSPYLYQLLPAKYYYDLTAVASWNFLVLGKSPSVKEDSETNSRTNLLRPLPQITSNLVRGIGKKRADNILLMGRQGSGNLSLDRVVFLPPLQKILSRMQTILMENYLHKSRVNIMLLLSKSEQSSTIGHVSSWLWEQ